MAEQPLRRSRRNRGLSPENIEPPSVRRRLTRLPSETLKYTFFFNPQGEEAVHNHHPSEGFVFGEQLRELVTSTPAPREVSSPIVCVDSGSIKSEDFPPVLSPNYAPFHFNPQSPQFAQFRDL